MRKQISRTESTSSVGTLARGLDILELFAGESPELTQKEISERLGLPVPTVHRLTKLLVERGWLVRDPGSRRLRLGLGVARLLPALLSGLRLPELARDHLRGMAERTGETVNLAVLHGGEVVYLMSESGSRLLTLRSTIGLRLPVHCTALGKCLLAQLPEEEARRTAGREPYAALTPRTVTTWAELRASLDKVRRRRVAESHEEYEVGLDSIAVPLAWVEGEGPAAVNVSLPSSRAVGSAGTELTRELREVGRAIEADAGIHGRAGGGRVIAGTAPYWLDAPYEPRPPLQGEVETDVCVIGAGVCGLSCARRLAQHGIDAVVLERGTVAGGASGRNGGFLLAGVAPFHNDARERFGPDRARAMYARTLAAQSDVYELAAELGAGDAVRRVGMLRVAVSEEEAVHVRRHAEALREDGFPGDVVEHEELPAALRRGGLVACLTENDGALHPARWYRLLAGAAEAAGARICEGSPVRGPVPAPDEGPVTTDAGSVRARHVVVAADGALPALVPDYAGRVRPRRLHMIATAPLPPAFDTLVYARWGYEYLQQRPDGRILGGGFSDVDADDSYTDSDAGSPEMWERMERYLREELGADPEVTHRWAGVVGYTEDALPYVGEVPGRARLYVSGGYSGVGNVPGFMSGRDLADTIAGDAPEPLFPPGR